MSAAELPAPVPQNCPGTSTEAAGKAAACAAVATRQLVEALSREHGYDVTGTAYHLDALTPAGRLSYWRRLHKRTGSEFAHRKMLEVSKDMRARRSGPIRVHRAG